MAQSVLSKAQLSTFAFCRGACRFLGHEPQTPDPDHLDQTLADLRKVQGDALIIGGVAVIHYGYERVTQDIDILYANYDTKILERLKPYFKLKIKAKSGWHKLEHKKTKVRLELVPEGGLTQYGFIPGPQAAGAGRDGVISLVGLVWLKLVSGRIQDIADLARLAFFRFSAMDKVKAQLPPELQERYEDLLRQAKDDIDHDPFNPRNQAKEPPSKYFKRKPARRKRKTAQA